MIRYLKNIALSVSIFSGFDSAILLNGVPNYICDSTVLMYWTQRVALRTVSCQNNKSKPVQLSSILRIGHLQNLDVLSSESKCTAWSWELNVRTMFLVLHFGLGSQMVHKPTSREMFPMQLSKWAHLQCFPKARYQTGTLHLFFFHDLDYTHLKLVVSMAGHWKTAGLDNDVTTS